MTLLSIDMSYLAGFGFFPSANRSCLELQCVDALHQRTDRPRRGVMPPLRDAICP